MSTRRSPVLPLVCAVLLLAGCGGEGDDAGGEVVRVTITGDDRMRFDRSVIEVPAGATVQLTLEHTGKLPLESMGHNFVLLQQGTDVDNFALAAASALETDYIPARRMDKVIAHTRMLGGGESDTIRFAAPPPGTYEFICSFPGHYSTMRGTFVVR